jgi:hypothetical protein
MAQSSKTVEEFIREVDSTGNKDALIDIINIIELNTFFRNYSIEEKIARFNAIYDREKIEVILTNDEIDEIAGYFLLWAEFPETFDRAQILWGLRYFPGGIGAKVILEIIQKYGDDLNYSGSQANEISGTLKSLTDAFFWNRDFDEIKARDLLTKMNPIPFLKKYIDFPDDEINEIASYAGELLDSFTQILNGYTFDVETNELHPPQKPISKVPIN